MLDTWECWLCSTSLLTKDHVHPRCSPMRSVFSRLLTRLLQLAGSMRDSITRVFPPDSHVSSALCPGVTGFHQLSSYGSVRRCSPVQDAQRVSSVPEIRKPTRLAPFSQSIVLRSALRGSPLCRLFPPPVQVLSVHGPPCCAMLVVCDETWSAQ